MFLSKESQKSNKWKRYAKYIIQVMVLSSKKKPVVLLKNLFYFLKKIPKFFRRKDIYLTHNNTVFFNMRTHFKYLQHG